MLPTFKNNQMDLINSAKYVQNLIILVSKMACNGTVLQGKSDELILL